MSKWLWKNGYTSRGIHTGLDSVYGKNKAKILALLAEIQVKGEAFTEVEQCVWDKFKELLSKFLDLMYNTNYTFTDKQVAMIVQSTAAEMNKQGKSVEYNEKSVIFAKSQNNEVSKSIS